MAIIFGNVTDLNNLLISHIHIKSVKKQTTSLKFEIYSPSPVIKSHNTEGSEYRKNSCFTFLYGPMIFRKILVQTTKWSTSLKIPNFQNGGISAWCP